MCSSHETVAAIVLVDSVATTNPLETNRELGVASVIHLHRSTWPTLTRSLKRKVMFHMVLPFVMNFRVRVVGARYNIVYQ